MRRGTVSYLIMISVAPAVDAPPRSISPASVMDDRCRLCSSAGNVHDCAMFPQVMARAELASAGSGPTRHPAEPGDRGQGLPQPIRLINLGALLIWL
ncbi:hypothetical protein LX15_001513 [Streptoalloteichus tenebrarius]|uniref:Uncharacterized protein n=1 Tax=Streptoalloteichus tenebrarius (strain ATCC 17920 / DSM 40477 / JCM 4838 / CBS 697.72 / NBRC 16177 / NCIMB 11028 / NRRL B-12390 / A12253. 1 / ISP 5477) TaxID=1933 RepID=A0ABT1HQQ4_STRSD|nr:hypothetical protein [Streptoalloteichus tenebrarius]MCP2257827.1 hypothetical protein [Streptoalloteichus tenebrarius]